MSQKCGMKLFRLKLYTTKRIEFEEFSAKLFFTETDLAKNLYRAFSTYFHIRHIR